MISLVFRANGHCLTLKTYMAKKVFFLNSLCGTTCDTFLNQETQQVTRILFGLFETSFSPRLFCISIPFTNQLRDGVPKPVCGEGELAVCFDGKPSCWEESVEEEQDLAHKALSKYDLIRIVKCVVIRSFGMLQTPLLVTHISMS